MFKMFAIGFGIIVLVSGLTVGILYVIKQNQPVAQTVVTTNQNGTYIVDTSKDFGACRVFSIDQIKTALGEPAKSLAGPENLGYIRDTNQGEHPLSSPLETQTCVYSFIAGGTKDNRFNSDNGLSVAITKVKTKADSDSLISALKSDKSWSPVVTLGDSVYFSAQINQPHVTTNHIQLKQFKDLTLYVYTLDQPVAETAYTSDSARVALSALATLVK
jgi:hypothetical protein